MLVHWLCSLQLRRRIRNGGIIQRDTSILYRANPNTTFPPGSFVTWRIWRIRVRTPGVWMLHCHMLVRRRGINLTYFIFMLLLFITDAFRLYCDFYVECILLYLVSGVYLCGPVWVAAAHDDGNEHCVCVWSRVRPPTASSADGGRLLDVRWNCLWECHISSNCCALLASLIFLYVWCLVSRKNRCSFNQSINQSIFEVISPIGTEGGATCLFSLSWVISVVVLSKETTIINFASFGIFHIFDCVFLSILSKKSISFMPSPGNILCSASISRQLRAVPFRLLRAMGDRAKWRLGLLRASQKPEKQLYSDDFIVILADHEPKARFHFLVLPKADIDTVEDLLPKYKAFSMFALAMSIDCLIEKGNVIIWSSNQSQEYMMMFWFEIISNWLIDWLSGSDSEQISHWSYWRSMNA